MQVFEKKLRIRMALAVTVSARRALSDCTHPFSQPVHSSFVRLINVLEQQTSNGGGGGTGQAAPDPRDRAANPAWNIERRG